MKVSLVVSQGLHKGKTIPIPVVQFVIGRDEGCQLRPSSPAVSKRHCALLVRSGKIFIQDFGSTNGTFVNDQPVTGQVEINDNDRIKIGPLEFVLRAVHAEAAPSTTSKKAAQQAVAAATPPPKDEPTKEQPVADPFVETDADHIAAMLLATDDGPPGPLTEASIPGGTTIFELPVGGEDPNAPATTKKAAPPPEPDNSKRAGEILRKYMQRPRQP